MLSREETYNNFAGVSDGALSQFGKPMKPAPYVDKSKTKKKIVAKNKRKAKRKMQQKQRSK